jgi:hypothetical protein
VLNRIDTVIVSKRPGRLDDSSARKTADYAFGFNPPYELSCYFEKPFIKLVYPRLRFCIVTVTLHLIIASAGWPKPHTELNAAASP